MMCYYLFMLVVYSLLIPQIPAWETPSPHQYHIQTDEGPERYFRYQTDSGQYRKEKRLEDGTVVGTYAWIDADGILRQRDYIADNAGYRILKNKNVFVGRNINVGEAVKASKKYPATSGTLVKTGLQHTRPVVVPYKSYSPSTSYTPSTTASSVYNYIPSSTPSPLSYNEVSTTYIPTTTPSPIPISTTPSIVDVTHNSIDSSTPFRIIIPTETPIVEITPNSFLKPSYPNNLSYLSQSTISPYQSTPSLISVSTQSPLYSQEDFGGSQEVDHNSLEYNPYVRHIKDDYRFQNGPTYPLDKKGKPYIGSNTKAAQTYDGVSVTNDGFRYYIPRAYHEEQTLSGEERSGSFGYIDPFGIRRVIYYNTAPGTGFNHRKNNRYVGFNAPPYDPRPY